MTSSEMVGAFYDDFASRVLSSDLTEPNIRQLAAIELVRSNLKAGMRVLEIGCGAGVITREIASLGCKVTAADISQRNVDLTRFVCSGLTVSVTTCDITADTMPVAMNGQYDAVVLADVIEHLPPHNRARALVRLASLLRSGGRMLLTFPTIEYQQHLKQNDPAGLQIVDEEIDPFSVARESGLLIRSLAWVDVWMSNQYNHLVLEKQAERQVVPLPSPPDVGRIGRILWRLRGAILSRSLASWRKGKVPHSHCRNPLDKALSRAFWMHIGLKGTLSGARATFRTNVKDD